MAPPKTYLPLLLFPAALICVSIDFFWGSPVVAAIGLLLASLGFLFPVLVTARGFLTHHWRWFLAGASLVCPLQPWVAPPLFQTLAILFSLPLLVWGNRYWRAVGVVASGLALGGLLGLPIATQWGTHAALVAAGILGLALLLGLFFVATLFPKVGITLTVLCVLSASGVGILNALPPSLQFNGLMVVYLLGFILATTAVASLVTFLLVKSLEYLSDSPIASLTWATPMLLGPAYFMERYLASSPWASSLSLPSHIALGLSGVSLIAWALLAIIIASARRLSYRQLVADIAWKFLRSQRQVPTLKTRVVLGLRDLVPSGHSQGWASLFARITIPLALAAAAFPLARFATSDTDYQTLFQAGALAVAAAYLLLQAFGRCTLVSGFSLALTAILLSLALAVRLYYSPLALRPTFLWIAVSLSLFPALLLFTRGILRLYLGFKSTTLHPSLDPRLAPPIVNRIAQGVGPSIFVSLVGVAVGVWALILVLSVMSGFSNELQQRIVKAKDHVMVKTLPGTDRLNHPFALAQKISGIPAVAHASPYVEGEAMMSGSVNISPTVTIRGIDPRDGGLDFLRQMLVAGDPDFLVHPETLIPFPGMQVQFPALELPFPSPEQGPQADSGPADEAEDHAQDMPQDQADGTPQERPDDDEDLDMMPIPGLKPDTASPLDQPSPFNADGLVAMPDPGGDDPADAPPPILTSGDTDLQLLPAVFIGRELARALGATPGSVIQVISPDGDVGPMGVQPRARPFRIAGIFQTGMYEYDLKTAFMLMSEAQRFFNLGNDVDHIDVRLSDTSKAGEVAQSIHELLSDENAEVLTWEEMNKNLFSALKLEQMMMFIVLGFIIIIASFNIISSLILIIRRRLSAIAILKTMGAGPNQIMQVFLLLGFSAGLFGTFSGVLLGLLSSGLVGELGITLPKEYYVRSIPVLITGWQVGAVAVASMIVTGLAALYPGRLGSRVGIVEGLKDER